MRDGQKQTAYAQSQSQSICLRADASSHTSPGAPSSLPADHHDPPSLRCVARLVLSRLCFCGPLSHQADSIEARASADLSSEAFQNRRRRRRVKADGGDVYPEPPASSRCRSLYPDRPVALVLLMTLFSFGSILFPGALRDGHEARRFGDDLFRLRPFLLNRHLLFLPSFVGSLSLTPRLSGKVVASPFNLPALPCTLFVPFPSPSPPGLSS